MDGTNAEHHRHRGMSGHSQLKVPGSRAPVLDCLCIASVGRCVPALAFDRPEVAALVIEDVCWRIAMADWAARRPSVWRRRARAAWCADGELLQAERDRIALIACEVGLRP